MYLNCHSQFSFKYGVMSIPQLINEAVKKKIDALVLTDINCTAGVYPFIKAAYAAGIHPVIGIDFRNGSQQKYIGIAKSPRGYHQLNKHLSLLNQTKQAVPNRAPEMEDTFIIYPFSESVFHLRENEYIGVSFKDLNHLHRSQWKHHTHKLVLLHPVTFTSQLDFNAHRLLRCIDGNILLSQLNKMDQGQISDQFLSYPELIKKYDQYHFLLTNAQQLIEQCHFSFYFKGLKNKKYFTASEKEDVSQLRMLTEAGALKRYKVITPIVRERIEKEFDLIIKKNFVAYFLINYDIVRYAKSRGFYHVGRGSGANSVIAYCLEITNVDPIELDLYFERFINLFRDSPPDFDIDFSWKDRDEVISYIFQKYNSPHSQHVCLLATHNTFQTNSSFRELAKVFGLPKEDIENIIQLHKDNQPLPDQISTTVAKYAQFITDLPSHLSIHAGGILISEDPIYDYTALDYPPKGFPISNFDMITADEINLHKFDILSQRGLGHIKESLDIIQKNRNIEIDINDVDRFKQDEKIKELLREGKTIGCFYVESPAMRMLLSKLQDDSYLGLVAASSIIRPGVARSGMMREYISRHREFKKTGIKGNDIMWELMPDTYGVMVYQEDVIKVAHHFAGIDPDAADILRRGMSGKFRSREEFERVKNSFFSNAAKKKRPLEQTTEVWRQIESFAGYSFAKGHSASFAIESYQSLYLKAYYPLEFMVAVINNFGGFYHTELYIHEAKRLGAQIQSVDINISQYYTLLIDKTIYLGFAHLKFIRDELKKQILHERNINGSFTSLHDFMKRIEIQPDQLKIMIKIDAFRFTGKTKEQLLWESNYRLSFPQDPIVKHHALFKKDTFEDKVLPDLASANRREELLYQLEAYEFPLHSPFLLPKDQHLKSIKAKSIPQNKGNLVQIIGYLVTYKNTRTVKNERMYFGTFMDKHGDWIDTIHFPNSIKKHNFKGKAIYLIRGIVEEEYNFFAINVSYMQRVEYWNKQDEMRGLYTESQKIA
ncbi:DNA polymerase III subunit alpha [Penaeicola halotolerans]|uniref:DNA polymerase III subunit alpha n=1 Tax=Penaeicola halotolerans TaxID=2793196 RepID=UPI001CF87926|nr:DNA polymerase III subunit alpha [Penaeicola halotolerans]